MNIRHPFLKLAALGALVTALPLLMAPSGGYPTNPIFRSIRGQSQVVLVGAAATNPGWDSSANAFTFAGFNDAIYLYHLGANMVLSANLYSSDGSTWKYSSAGGGVLVNPNSGAFDVLTAPVGVAGATAALNDALHIDINGNISTPGTGTVPWVTAGGACGGGCTAPVVGTVSAGNTRTSTTTATCDSALTITQTGINQRWAVHAFLDFAGNGATGNGWKAFISPAGTGAVAQNQMMVATTNTSSGNLAPVANTSAGGGQPTATFPTAGTDVDVTLDTTVTGATSGSTTICVSWAQNTSSATSTTLVNGYMTLTRIL